MFVQIKDQIHFSLRHLPNIVHIKFVKIIWSLNEGVEWDRKRGSNFFTILYKIFRILFSRATDPEKLEFTMW